MSMFSVLQPMADASPLSTLAPPGHRLHSRLAEIRAAQPVDGWFSFAVVRNPWSRLASLYAFTAAGKADPALYPEFHHAADAVRCGGIVEFLERFADHPLMVPQAEWISVDGAVAVDFVGRFESLADDWSTIAQRIGIGGTPLPHDNRSGAAPGDYRRLYSDEAAAVVAARFRTDVELFGYRFDDFAASD